jgi:hypothetical protein
LLALTVIGRSESAREATATPRAPEAAAGLARLRSFSLQGQAVISGSLGAADPAFAAQRSDGGFRLAGGGLDAEVRDDRLSIGTGDESLSMSLAGVGRADRLGALSAGIESAHGNRVGAAYPRIVAWYAAGPLGIEQGFTVLRRPAGGGRGPLTLALRLGGRLRPVRAGSQVRFLTSSGRVIDRYGGLAAFDANGRRLAATLALAGRSLLLRIADRRAAYPLRIDPFIEQQEIAPADGSGTAGTYFGASVALSSDGSTALIGANDAMNGMAIGAAWVYTQSNGMWTERNRSGDPVRMGRRGAAGSGGRGGRR